MKTYILPFVRLKKKSPFQLWFSTGRTLILRPRYLAAEILEETVYKIVILLGTMNVIKPL